MPGTAEAPNSENEISLTQRGRRLAHPAAPSPERPAAPQSPKATHRNEPPKPGTRKRKRQPYHPDSEIVNEANEIMREYHYKVLVPLQKMEKRVVETNKMNDEIIEANLKVFHKAVQYIDKSIEKLKPLNTHKYESDGGRRRTRHSRR